MLSTSESLLNPDHRQTIVLLVSVWFTSACGIGGSQNFNTDSTPVFSAATQTPVEPADESIPAQWGNSPADASGNTGGNDRPVETTMNMAPNILDTSYGCNPNTESVLLSVGETDNFTLSVEDEFPLSMQFDADIGSPGIVNISVNENGIFTVIGLQKGESDVWLSVSDHEGLIDEYELHIIVE